MACQIDQVLHSKVNNYLNNRRYSKSTRFSVPNHVERSCNLVEDLYTLAQNRFQNYAVCESEVWCERYDNEHPVKIFTRMKSDYFWEFVNSSQWQSVSSLRITPGALLDKLINALHRLEYLEEIVSVETIYVDTVERPSLRSHYLYNTIETRRICLKYYGRNLPPDAESYTESIKSSLTSSTHSCPLRNTINLDRSYSVFKRFSDVRRSSEFQQTTTGPNLISKLNSRVNSLPGNSLSAKDRLPGDATSAWTSSPHLNLTNVRESILLSIPEMVVQSPSQNVTKTTASSINATGWGRLSAKSPSGRTSRSSATCNRRSTSRMELKRRSLTEEDVRPHRESRDALEPLISPSRNQGKGDKDLKRPGIAENELLIEPPVFNHEWDDEGTPRYLTDLPSSISVDRTDICSELEPSPFDDCIRTNASQELQPRNSKFQLDEPLQCYSEKLEFLKRRASTPKFDPARRASSYNYSDKLEFLKNSCKSSPGFVWVSRPAARKADYLQVCFNTIQGQLNPNDVFPNRPPPCSEIDVRKLNSRYSNEHLLPQRIIDQRTENARNKRQDFVQKWYETLIKYDMYTPATGKLKKTTFLNPRRLPAPIRHVPDKVQNKSRECDKLGAYYEVTNQDRRFKDESFLCETDTFLNDLLYAMDRFVIRKELVVINPGRKTITTVTINRVITS